MTDVFLAKYTADGGELVWLKRLGQRDSYESAVSRGSRGLACQKSCCNAPSPITQVDYCRSDLFCSPYCALPIWGQVALVVDDFNQEIIVLGDFYNNFDKEMYRDIFDLVAGGRPSVIGCQVPLGTFASLHSFSFNSHSPPMLYVTTLPPCCC